MKKLSVLVGVFCALVLLSSSVFALDIQVAPQTIVLSAGGGKLSVHTDVPLAMVDSVSLAVNGTTIKASIFADDCGNLVARCSKEAVKDVIGDFEGKTTTATVALTVNGDSDQETIRVKK